MLRLIKEVQSDDSVVGFYQSTSMGAFFAQSLVELQATHQERLRHGGVVIVHGMRLWSYCVYVSFNFVADTNQAARANATFRAFRLAPAYLEALKKDKFGTQSYVNPTNR